MDETHGPELALPSIMPSAGDLGGYPDDRGRQAGSASSKHERLPWRTVGTGVVSLGTPAAIWMLCPVLGEVIAAIEVAVMLMIISTALFGSPELSERAFRLLRLFGNRPEPRVPSHFGADNINKRQMEARDPEHSRVHPDRATDVLSSRRLRGAGR